EIKIYGDNQKKLQQLAQQISEITENVKGTADVFDGIIVAGPSVNIEPDNRALAQYNVSAADFQYQLQSQLEGNVIGSIFEKEQITNIRMMYPNSTKTSLEKMKAGNIFLPDGKLKSLTTLADITVDSGTAEIERENLQSMIPVTARLDNRDLGSVMRDIQNEIHNKVHLPQGNHISYGGAYEEQQRSFSELLLILLSAALLVFTTMLFLFREIKGSLLIIFIAALGISGSLLALYLTNTALNVGSYTGIIMIIGIIGENAIFTFLQFTKAIETNSLDDAITFSISRRLRPNLMTAFGAIIALLPIALGIGTGAQLHQPLAIAVIGGFLIAIPLLLIILPSMLRLIFRSYKTKISE
ncbi:MAG: efflux RND transporter permease subunit, partial [Bacteroidota bacterium]